VRFEIVKFAGNDPCEFGYYSLFLGGKLVLEKPPMMQLLGESEERRKEDDCVKW